MSEYSVTIEKLRPTGYEFPVGNNTKDVGSQPDSYFDSLGGTKTFSGDYVIHTFTSSGTFKDYSGSTGHDCEFLVIAGGGAGGQTLGGGGGSGGFRYGTNLPIAVNLEYLVVVGSGGQGTTNGAAGSGPGNDSEIFNINLAPHTQANSAGYIFADGGGRGGSGAWPQQGPLTRFGGNGGCGGGGGGGWDAQGPAAPQGITDILNTEGSPGQTIAHPVGNPAVQGFNGGSGKGRPNTIPGQSTDFSKLAGGGGGIASVGSNGGANQPNRGGYGGSGTAYSISGSPVAYGGGGAGAGGTGGLTPPAGGGDYVQGYNGTDNRGGGGGGVPAPAPQDAGQPVTAGGNGGSGIVIIRYAKTGLTGYEVN